MELRGESGYEMKAHNVVSGKHRGHESLWVAAG
jgi:hypothetical protein